MSINSGSMADDIVLIWLPIAFAVLLGLIGLFRGARREAVVSLAIVLGALVITVWGTPWSTDIHATFTQFSPLDVQVVLGFLVLGLIVLVAGYGLGSAVVPRGPLSALSRLGGFLIGVGNGSAIAGWLMRNQYNTLLSDLTPQNTDTLHLLGDTIFTKSLIIWAGWFPLAVALVAAIIALVGPFRRAQTVVSTPSTSTDWAPSTAPAAAAPAPTAGAASYVSPYTPGYGAPAGPGASMPPTTPVRTSPSPSPYGAPAGYVPSTTSFAGATRDAPPTAPMPVSDPTRPVLGGQDTLNLSTPPAPPPPSSSPSSSQPNSGWVSRDEPSWLTSSLPTRPSEGPAQAERAERSEAPTVAQPILPSTPRAEQQPSGATATRASNDSSTVSCPRCGSTMPADATFCTECGNRLRPVI